MANQISKDKQRLNIVIERKLVDMLDLEAKTSGTTRTAVIVAALREHFEKAAPTDLDVIKARLDAMEAQQAASTTLLVEAIRNQPIAIQEAPSLPEPEPQQEEYERTWFGLYRRKR